MSRIIKSKIYKPFIALLVAVILVFSFEVNKPKAIVPILLWGGGVLAGVIAEEMLEMGIRHVTADGKTSKKGKAGKIADEILDSLDGYDFDNTNPTRKADGSLEVNMSANDRAKIARKIADEFGDIITDDDARRIANSAPSYVNTDGESDPMYGTSVSLDIEPNNTGGMAVKAYDIISSLYYVEFAPKAFERKTEIKIISSVTGYLGASCSASGGYNYELDVDYSFVSANDPYATGASNVMEIYERMPNGGSLICPTYLMADATTRNLYINYLKAQNLANGKLYTARGLVVPQTLKNVYKIGDGYQGDELPNRQELSNKPYKIPNFFEPSESDGDVTWETVQNHYDNDVTTNQTKIDNEYETYLENGDLNNITNNYTTQTINNYYTDTNYPVKADDASLIVNIDIDIPPPVVIDDDDDGGTGTVKDGESAPVIDRTLISYAKQTYDYLGDSIDGAIVSMRDITDDASGLVDYLDTSFRWLPAEWRALFGSAFILGVFAHFMRR